MTDLLMLFSSRLSGPLLLVDLVLFFSVRVFPSWPFHFLLRDDRNFTIRASRQRIVHCILELLHFVRRTVAGHEYDGQRQAFPALELFEIGQGCVRDQRLEEPGRRGPSTKGTAD